MKIKILKLDENNVNLVPALIKSIKELPKKAFFIDSINEIVPYPKECPCYVALDTDANCLAGIIALDKNLLTDYPYSWNIDLLAVNSSYRRKGIATKLINKILKLNNNSITVDTWSTEDFKPACLFYEKMGFKRQAVIKKYYGYCDYILYSKTKESTEEK